MRLYYTLKTLDPVIVSQNHATTNNHECLDYIPGSAILGALAARHYVGLTTDESWHAFHSGECRFSPCYPVANGQLSLPTPISWHFAKGADVINKDSQQYNTEVLSNHAAIDFEREETTQYKQCREGYLNANGKNARVTKSLSTKTSIDNATGKAKESQLYSYSYLEAGQTFAGWIDCSSVELLNTFRSSLNGTVRIGRSRNTEFGRVELKIQNIDALPKPKNLGNRLVLWCLSDSELLDENGFPTLSPRVESIHPDLAGTLDFQHSFINNARISRFNQKRHGMDGEQLVISKGSVLVYQLDAKPDDQVLAEISQKGIGLNRQQGLGWVSVNPAWAEKSRLDSQNLFVPIYIQPDITAQTREVSTALIGWVKERVSANNTINQTQERVNSLLKEICIAYQNARHYNNILISNEAGPSSTQWRRIANEVRTSNEQWSVCVFSGNQPICKADNDELGWGIQWHNGEVLTNFAVHTRAKIANESVTTMRLLLEQLCRYDLSTFQGLKKIAKELHLDRDSQ